MNANKQDAGGLPELPSPIGWYRAWLPSGEPVDEFMPGANRPDDWPVTDCAPMWSRRAMRAYGELCRAAPAGGEDLVRFATRMASLNLQEVGGDLDDRIRFEVATFLRSAPAGAGEVDIEEFREAVELLRITSLGGKRDCERHGTFPHDFDRSLAKADRLIALIDSRAALLRKLQQGADYVVVPREPTEAMMSAWFNGICNDGRTLKIDDDIRAAARQDWAVMIAASQDQDGGK